MSKQHTPRDPVCGIKINKNKAHIVITHNGVDYYLCCPKCQAEFEANPDHYIREGDGR